MFATRTTFLEVGRAYLIVMSKSPSSAQRTLKKDIAFVVFDPVKLVSSS